MISSVISHVSALVLAVAGVALLFASDVVLPYARGFLIPGTRCGWWKPVQPADARQSTPLG